MLNIRDVMLLFYDSYYAVFICRCTGNKVRFEKLLTLRRRIKSHLLFAGIIRSSPFSPRQQDKG